MSPDRGVIGWDLGGAHLKAAALDANGRLAWVRQRPLPLWQGLDRLTEALAAIATAAELDGRRHAITMTGELVDLFDDRQGGVATLTQAMTERLPPGAVLIYAGPAGFVAPPRAGALAAEVASANWHATASWMAAQGGAGLLVDVGSTTTDILALAGGRVWHDGYSDQERLRSGELVYTGIVRTPVMAVAQRVPFAGEWQTVANEHFATMADVYRILGELPAGADQHPTADGREPNLEASERRLARMVGTDRQAASAAHWRTLAAYVAEQQLRQLADACSRLHSRAQGVAPRLIGAGVGRQLVARLGPRLGCEVVDGDRLLGATPGADAAWCAPAVAVARLAHKEALACAC